MSLKYQEKNCGLIPPRQTPSLVQILPLKFHKSETDRLTLDRLQTSRGPRNNAKNDWQDVGRPQVAMHQKHHIIFK